MYEIKYFPGQFPSQGDAPQIADETECVHDAERYIVRDCGRTETSTATMYGAKPIGEIVINGITAKVYRLCGHNYGVKYEYGNWYSYDEYIYLNTISPAAIAKRAKNVFRDVAEAGLM